MANTKQHHQLLIFLALAILGTAGIVWTSKAGQLPSNRRTVGAIIPHHELAEGLIDDLADRLVKEKPKKILIIGPNHFGIGSQNIEEKEAEKDHACGEPKKVLANKLLGTEIDCRLISDRVSESEIKNFVEKLPELLGDKGVLVASVDFSHYLPQGQAEKNDLVTDRLLNEWNTKELNKLGNGFLDSPKTISILFDYLIKIGGTEREKINHSNAAEILRKPDLASTTSYFEIIYYRRQ